MPADFFTTSDLLDFKEKKRLLEKKKNLSDRELIDITNKMKNLQNRQKRIETEKVELEKQIKKFDQLILYAQEALNRMAGKRIFNNKKRWH